MKMTSTVYMQMDLKVKVYSITALLFAKPVGVLIVRFLSFSCGVPLRFFFFFSLSPIFLVAVKHHRSLTISCRCDNFRISISVSPVRFYGYATSNYFISRRNQKTVADGQPTCQI